MRWWPWKRDVEQRSGYSIADPYMASMLGLGAPVAGQHVNETTALSLSAVYRSVCLIAGTIASLPLRTLTDGPDGTRQRVSSFLDNPAGADRQTPFEWTELVLVHLLLHGNAFLAHVYNGAGALTGLMPIHPMGVSVEANELAPGGKVFTVTLDNGQTRLFNGATMTHLTGPTVDGLRGLNPIAVARQSLGTALAGDRAAARMFSNGAQIAGLVTTEDDVNEDEAKVIKADLVSRMQGVENAGDIAFINRNLRFTPWQLSATDAQFLESRTFQVEEVGRWFGVPPHLLGQSEKSTSWGTGIEEQNRGLARYTLQSWTKRIEQRLSLLVRGRTVEFDYAGLLQPSPEQEIDLILKQIDTGLLTLNEARRIRNLPPLPGGDIPRQGYAQQTEPAAPAQEVPSGV